MPWAIDPQMEGVLGAFGKYMTLRNYFHWKKIFMGSAEFAGTVSSQNTDNGFRLQVVERETTMLWKRGF